MRRATAWIDDAPDGDLALLFTGRGIAPFYERAGWEVMPAIRVLVGDAAAPRVHQAVSMMRFLSPHGLAHRAALEGGEVYVGEDPW